MRAALLSACRERTLARRSWHRVLLGQTASSPKAAGASLIARPRAAVTHGRPVAQVTGSSG